MGTSRTKEDQILLRKLGQSLKELREAKKLTQETLAYKAGFSRSYYTEVENGKRNISLINLKKLSLVLEVSICEILKHV